MHVPSFRRFSIAALCGLALVLGSSRAAARDGTLGIFFDPDGRDCTGSIPTSAVGTLYVLLIAEGATFDGITGAEFRIEAPPGAPFLFRNPIGANSPIMIGDPLTGGCNIAWGTCQRGSKIPIMSFQVFSTGQPARDVPVRISARLQPANPMFPCALAVQCDTGTYTLACVVGGQAILNPSGTQPCDTSRIESQWTRMKDLYKP